MTCAAASENATVMTLLPNAWSAQQVQQPMFMLPIDRAKNLYPFDLLTHHQIDHKLTVFSKMYLNYGIVCKSNYSKRI
jgi:hypothetical protein